MEPCNAILSDIHSNLEALEAVLDDARDHGASEYYCLGDVVGYNANPHECIAKIRELGALTIRGNHDHYCSHNESLEDFQPNAASVIAWTRRQLTQEDESWLATLPMSKVVNGITYVHGTLDMPEHWGYVFDLLDAEAHFSYQTTPVCFHGHTHVPVIFAKRGSEIERIDPPPSGTRFKFAFGRRYFVNVGGVGQPRDGNPRASYVLYYPKTREIEFRRVSYDIETASEKVRQAGLPERLADRLLYGR